MRRIGPARPIPRAISHLLVMGLVAASAAFGIAAARFETGGVGSLSTTAADLSFDLVAPVRAVGGDSAELRSGRFDLEPDPNATPEPMLSRLTMRFDPTPAPTPLPTPVAPPPPAPDPKPAAPAPRPAPAPVVGSGALAWPVSGGSISQYFHAGHLALDIAAPYGTTVMAADAGVVTWAGWRNNGGGYVIAIDHGNGIQSLYNHLGSIWVAPGQAVTQGQGIAGVGCTGICTGPHVHFEVVVNGVLVNPLRYL